MLSPADNPPLHDDPLAAKLAVDPPGYAHAYLKFKLLGPSPQGEVCKRLHLVKLSGTDGVSTPFELQLQLHGNTDPKLVEAEQIAFSNMLGQPATVAVTLPFDWHDPAEPCCADRGTCVCPQASGGGQGASSCRCSDYQFEQATAKKLDDPKLAVFNGIIASFSMAEPGVYVATLRPALWKLQLTNRYRILQKRSIKDAIATVLDEHGITYDLSSLDGDDANPAVSHIQDWFQAGESDLAFISRLMEKANLFYYFVHRPASHCVVISNVHYYWPALPKGRTMRYTYTDATPVGLDQEYIITHYRYQHSLSTSGVNALFDRQQSVWEVDPVAQAFPYVKDAPALPAAAAGGGNETAGEPAELPFNLYRIYEYGMSDDEVARFREQQDDMRESAASGISGSSQSPLFRAGHIFQLAEAKVRPVLDTRNFVLTGVRHEASLDGSYSNTFEATEITKSGGLITPFNIQQTRQGSVLAKVVGTTTPTDWRYLEKSDFDPSNCTLATASGDDEVSARGAYVVLSTDGLDGGASANGPIWVKLAAHMQTCPQVGALVLIGRSGDESDLPEIQSVFDSHGSYTVNPNGWIANTTVGGNYSTSYGDSKSIRYGAASSTNLQSAVSRIESQYATSQFRDVSYSQGGSYSYSTADAGMGGMLSTSESIGNTFSKQQAAITQSESTIGSATSVSRITTNTSTSTISTSTSTDTIGTHSSTSTIGTSTSTSTIGTSTSTSTVGISTSNSVVGTSTNISTVGLSTSLSTVGVNAAISTTGVNGSVSTTGVHSALNTVGVSSSIDTIGVSSSINTTGASTSLSTVGTTTQTSAVGVSTGVSATGVSTQANATGTSTQASATGANTVASATGTNTVASAVGTSTEASAVGTSVKADAVATSVSSQSVLASVSQNSVLAEVSDNFRAASVSSSVVGSSVTSNIVGSSVSSEVIGSLTSSRIVGSETSLNVDATTTVIKAPGITITMDLGLDMNTLTLQIVL